MVAVVLVALLVLLAAPAPGQAACGSVRMAEPTHVHDHQRPPLAIGDSTMLLALYNLAAAGYEANAHGCRQFPEALALLRQRKTAGTLPHMVVIALGADGSISHDDIGQALGLLCCTHLLVLVTPRELGGGSGSDAAVVREEVHKHPGRSLLLDWVRYSAGHGDWFQPDGVHLTTAGAVAFTDLMRRALASAYPPPPPEPDQPTGRPRRLHHPSADPGTPAVPLQIRTSLAHLGYVAASVIGPAGSQVQLGERRGGSTRPIATIQLGSGRADVPQAIRWSCTLRTRELVASTLPPSPPQQTVASVKTPSCAHRLAVAIPRRARVARELAIRLRDRWGIGALPVRICLSAPGARPDCHRWWVHRDTPRRTISFPVPRPGGWAVTVRGPGAKPRSALTWVQHPGGRIRLLAVGDSEMQILDDFLGQNLGPRGVDVTSDARISTGLTKPFFFDWQGHARQQAAALRPDATVMFIGANDGFSAGGVPCCSPAWSAGYANLVAQMMHMYLRGDAGRVYWFVLPDPRPGSFSSLFGGVDAGIRQAARRFAGRVSLLDAPSFFTPGGYRDFMTYQGQGFVIHESDGVHLSTSADRVAAELVMHQMLADRLIR
jgi:lysophospholipase L1-like esterase